METDLYLSPRVNINEDYEQRPAYSAGRFSEETDLKYYQNLFEEKVDDQNNKEK